MRKIVLIFLFIITAQFILYGTTIQSYACDKKITVTGTLRMVGNEPMTELILETKEKQAYAIIGDKKQELSGKQGYNITVTGKLVKPNGIAAQKAINVEKYEIKNP